MSVVAGSREGYSIFYSMPLVRSITVGDFGCCLTYVVSVYDFPAMIHFYESC